MNNQMGRELRYIIFRGTMPIHDKCAIDTRERFINPIQISLRCWPQPPLFELNRRSRNESNHIYISNLPTIESALGLLRKIWRVTKIFNALSEHTHSAVRLNILTSAQFQSPHGMLPSAQHKNYFAQNWQDFLSSPPRHIGREHAGWLGLPVGRVHVDVEPGEEVQQLGRQGVASAEKRSLARESEIFLREIKMRTRIRHGGYLL